MLLRIQIILISDKWNPLKCKRNQLNQDLFIWNNKTNRRDDDNHEKEDENGPNASGRQVDWIWSRWGLRYHGLTIRILARSYFSVFCLSDSDIQTASYVIPFKISTLKFKLSLLILYGWCIFQVDKTCLGCEYLLRME